jgi:hypothetical protein
MKEQVMGAHRRVERPDGRRGARLTRRVFLYGGGAVAVAGLATWQLLGTGRGAVGAVTTDAIGDKVQRLPKDQLPEFRAGGEVGRLYRYAVEHGDELQYIPCFCGCARFGHKSNRDCYVKASHEDGTLTFTSHAAT